MVNRHVMHVRQGMAAGGVIGRLMETVTNVTHHHVTQHQMHPQQDNVH